MKLNAKTTALVLIDLQNGILGRPLEPRSGEQVYAASMKLAERLRAAGGLVVRVRVSFAADFADAPRQPVDQALGAASLPAGWDQFPDHPEQQGDLVITKHQWGAFYGTGLELQLRRRGIRGIVLGGVSTSIGVESTARDAWERGFELVLAEDLCAAGTAEEHEYSFRHIMPRLSRVAASTAIELE